MKIRSILQLVMFLAVGQFIFSCSPAKYYEFAANKPETYNKAKAQPAEVTDITPTMSEVALAAANEKAAAAQAEPVLEASTEAKPVVLPKKAVALTTPATEPAKVTVTEAEAIAMAKEKMANMTKAGKKELKKELKEALRQSGGSRTGVVEIILAIILPPLAVFLHDGIGTSFWINLILTLLFFLPGIIHALLVVTDTI